jgi:hypothetical protein
MVQSPKPQMAEFAKVEDLIDRNQMCWKEQIIEDSFFEEEAKAILNIPLSPMLPKDRVI